MGQAANNRGRNASLDQKKVRAAGRGTHGSEPDFETPGGHGKTAGAFGNPGGTRPQTKRAKDRSSSKGT